MIYADNAATTRLSPRAREAMLPFLDGIYANPSSLHSPGQAAKEALEKARETIAGLLGCRSREIYFTSGGSESDNQAILSAAHWGQRQEKRHIISTAFEHHAVLHTLKKLEKQGFSVTYLDVGEKGLITAEQVETTKSAPSSPWTPSASSAGKEAFCSTATPSRPRDSCPST